MNGTNSLGALALSLTLSLAACASHDVRAVEASPPAQDAQAQKAQTSVAADLAAANAAFNAGKWEEAIEAFESVVEQDPSQGGAWFRLGYALHATGDLEHALAVHEKAAAFPQFAPIATYNLGCAHALLGHTDEAFAALNRSVELGFNQPGQLDGDTDLTSLHDDPRWAKLRERAAKASTQGGAQSGGTTAPAKGDPALRQMDFWVGEWNVTSAGGQLLGTNSITLGQNGFLVEEHWTGAGGDTGESINFWDRDAKVWRQFWVSGGGNVLQTAGTFHDGAMHMRGQTMFAGGKTVDQKMTLTPLADGRVRQFVEHSNDGGQTWKPSFEGFYSKRDAK